jgi:hypothetical protein
MEILHYCLGVLDQHSIDNAQDVRRYLAPWPTVSREPPVDDHEVPVGHDHADSYFSVDGAVLTRLKRPSRPGSI